jgi:hypothetical protein
VRTGAIAIVLAACVLAAPPARLSAAPPFDEAQVRGLLEKGRFTPQQGQAALALLDRAGREGLPVSMLVNRIREGIARRAEPKAVLAVVEDRLGQLQRADDVLDRCGQQGLPVRDRERSLLTLADAFAQEVTPGEALELIPPALQAKADAFSVARGAETLGRLSRKGFPVKDTREVVAAALGAAWPADRMEDLVGLFLEADSLQLSRDDARELLLQVVRDKKDGRSAVLEMRRNKQQDNRREP